MGASPGPASAARGEEAAGRTEIRLREGLSLLLLLLVCLCAVTLLKPDGDLDVWHRLALGKLIVESGEVPRLDPFAYTPTKPEWIDHEWGSALVFYEIATLAGQKGLLLLKAGLMFGTLCFMYLRARRALGRPPSLLFHLLLAGALAIGFMASVRPQAFTFVFFSLWLHLLERARDGDWRWSWLVPFSGLAWANLHGGFLAGFGLVVMFGAGELLGVRAARARRRSGESEERVRMTRRDDPSSLRTMPRRPASAFFLSPSARFGLLALAVGLVSLVSPYGLATWANLFDATTTERATIREWQSWDFFGPQLHLLGFRVLFCLALIALCARFIEKRPPDWATVLVLAVTAVLGLRVLKHVPLFVIASGPFACAWRSSRWERIVAGFGPAARRRLRTIGTAQAWLGRGLLLIASVFVLATVPMRVVLFDAFPVRAVDFIAQNRLQGNLLVPFNFGAYALWRLYPACRVSMDSRYEAVYQDSTFAEVRGFFGGEPGWSEFLDRFPHDIVLGPRKKQLEANMATRSDWVVAYEDERHRVWVRPAAQRQWPPLDSRGQEDPFSTAGKPRFAP